MKQLALAVLMLCGICGVFAESADTPRPKLIDLGAGKCIPCKMMAPILEELKTEYAGVLDVEFIDVWKDPDAGKRYGIGLIPTQIFFAPGGVEVFRHEGYFSKEEILAAWKDAGYDLNALKKTTTDGPSK